MPKPEARATAARDGDLDALSRLRSRAPAERHLALMATDEIRSAYLEALGEHYLARTSDDEIRAKAARKKLDEAKAAATTSGAVIFVFRNRGRAAWRELLDAHPPRPQDHEAQRQQSGEHARARWNHDTFGPAAIAFAVVEPEITAEEILELADDGRLTDGDLTLLLSAAIDVHEGNRIADLGN